MKITSYQKLWKVTILSRLKAVTEDLLVACNELGSSLYICFELKALLLLPCLNLISWSIVFMELKMKTLINYNKIDKYSFLGPSIFWMAHLTQLPTQLHLGVPWNISLFICSLAKYQWTDGWWVSNVFQDLK